MLCLYSEANVEIVLQLFLWNGHQQVVLLVAEKV